MSGELLLVLALLGVAIVLFSLGRPRADVVALLMVALLPFTGVIDVSEAIAGFADPSVVLIALLFVIGEGLVRTGLAQRISSFILRVARGDETVLLVALMLSVAAMGSVMSSTGVVAIFIPIVLRIARSSRIAPARLMMPLSVAALCSGMMTLVATAPNLVVHGELLRNGYEGFSFFAFLPFGVPVLALAIGWMLYARRWLGRGMPAAPSSRAPRLQDWIGQYRLEGRAFRVRVGEGSPLVGRVAAGPGVEAVVGVNVLAVERSGGGLAVVLDDGRRLAGDLVLSAIGLRPRTALAAGAGLPCDHGILTDADGVWRGSWWIDASDAGTWTVTGTTGVEGVGAAFRTLANPEAHAKILVEPWRA